ncbi:MAG: nucleotidyltransferase family protein [Sphingomonadales bacterium]|nr:nucleotidyltransferase family protein [Sphingomonadales bacterium]
MTRPVRDAGGAPSLTRLRRLLLALIAPRPMEAAQLARLRDADWARIAAMAQDHRLGPLLHHRCAGLAEIPSPLREIWRNAYRASALAAMAMKAGLERVTARLEGAGLAPVALKGAWLAWHGYRDPALRPLRDLDLLLTPDSVLDAHALLEADGYRPLAPPEMPLAAQLRFDKHLPELVSPDGIVVELHHRLWEPDGRLDHAMPQDDAAGFRRRASRCGAILYPAPEDMLAHLLIHATYGHRLDCGPLVLADIAALLDRCPIDWPAFWQRAAGEGWRPGARLLLAVAEQQGMIALPLPAEAGPPPPAMVLDAFPDLVLPPLETRQNAAVIASGLAGGAAALRRRTLGRRRAGGVEEPRDMRAEGGFAGWAGRRLWRLAGQLAKPGLWRQARALARFSRWLDAAADANGA